MSNVFQLKNIVSLFAFLLLVIISCDSPVGFSKAQPDGYDDLTELPIEFQGVYLCKSDSVLIKVNKNTIYTEFTELAITPMQYIEEREDCTLTKDSIHFKDHKKCIKVEYTKDGFVMNVKVSRDTLFRLTPFQRARMYKGNLVLSQITENDLWTIGLLQLDEDRGVFYKSITDESMLEHIEEVTPMTRVSANSNRYPEYKINPKLIEFDQLISDPTIFVDCDYYTRVHIVQ